MKYWMIFMLSTLLSIFYALQQPPEKINQTKWVVDQNSSLVVNGKTNVNKFSCAILQYAKSDTVLLDIDNQGNTSLHGSIHITVRNFNCNNLMMTKQLRATLNENKYPILRLKFTSFKALVRANTTDYKFKGCLEITIAGATKKFDVAYVLEKNAQCIVVTGKQITSFSDFNLVAPKKMGNLIRVDDQLTIVFRLKMEAASQ